MIERLTGGDIELDVMHGARQDRPAEGTHFKRAAHAATLAVDRVIATIAIADHDFSLASLHPFQPARGNLTGLRDFHQHSRPF